MKAIGMIETRGLLAAIESADAMLKAADVKLVKKEQVGGGIITIIVEGEVAAVKAAVDAGVGAVTRLGQALLSHHVIARPQDDLQGMLEPTHNIAIDKTHDSNIVLNVDDGVSIPELIVQQVPVSNQIMDRDYLSKLMDEDISFAVTSLNKMKTVELRTLARSYKDFSIVGRSISEANKQTLIQAFLKYYEKLDDEGGVVI